MKNFVFLLAGIFYFVFAVKAQNEDSLYYEEYKNAELSDENKYSEDDYYFDDLHTFYPDSSYYEEQVLVKKMDRDLWRDQTSGLDYSEKIEKKMPQPTRSIGDGAIHSIGLVLKIFFIGMGIAIITYILYKFFNSPEVFLRKDNALKNQKVTYDLDEIEENLLEVDLLTPIEKAIKDGDFSMAIRLYYLNIIRELANGNLIVWKKEKTNTQYLRELRGHSIAEKFAAITRTFERTWYGTTKISESEFINIEPDFKSMLELAKMTGQSTISA